VSDLQCPVRVCLTTGDEDQRGERVALVLDRAGGRAGDVVSELEELADLYRGEAVAVRLDRDLAADVVRLLTGARGTGSAGVTVVEGDADGWRLST
jgi:hypothetical protein